MNINIHVEQQKDTSKITRGVLQRGIQVVVILLIYAAMLFIPAGRLDWLMAWVYLAVYAGTVLINMAVIVPKNPEFIAARGQVKEDSKSWDKKLTGIAGIFMLGALVVPGLDFRLSGALAIDRGIQIAALVVLVFGYAIFSWAMLSNEFFETKVRIQQDRGQTVATTGPYQYVRHPGYVGMILQLLATPVMLGSLWGLIPAVIGCALFVLRTALEDKTLQNELEGYTEYAGRVPYRLLPGVW